MPRTLRSRRLRWLSPLAVLAVIVGLVTVPAQLASASPPSLPALTARQLLTRVQSGHPPTAYSGTIRLTSNLGIPNLSQLAGPEGSGLDVLSLLSGSHDARVWFDGPQRARVALVDQQLSETDFVRNGGDLWIWQSDGSQVTHRHLDATAPQRHGSQAPAGSPVPAPDQVAREFIAKVDPSTAISLRSPTWVAGRAVYRLVLSPRAAASTVSQVVIAVDSATGLPLRVAVVAKGQGKPAMEVGFRSISFARPAASTFSFTPPPGSHAADNPLSIGPGPRRFHRAGRGPVPPSPALTAGHAEVLGQGWTAVLVARGIRVPGALGPVLKAATAVSGGRLLQTPLVNVLLLDDGRVAAGAVTPATLESAVAGAG
jgi:outer membrane lipoprotein-sorting protein